MFDLVRCRSQLGEHAATCEYRPQEDLGRQPIVGDGPIGCYFFEPPPWNSTLPGRYPPDMNRYSSVGHVKTSRQYRSRCGRIAGSLDQAKP
jgi:hypothetical protein